MKKEISICNITAKQGQKAQGFINILDTETKMPITIINRKNSFNYGRSSWM